MEIKEEGRRCVCGRYACKDKVTDAHVVVDVKTGKSEKKGPLEM